MRYKSCGENKPKPLIFLAVYRLQPKLARFPANLNAGDGRSIKDFVLASLDNGSL